MRIVYRKLFRIRVRHGWYASAETHDDFELVPTESTAALLAATGLRVRHHPDGLSIFGEVDPDSNPPRLLRPLGSDALRFAFALRAVNPVLFNIADLPGPLPGRSLLCFDNLREDIDDQRRLLGDSITDARIGAPVSWVSSSVLTHEFAAPVEAAAIRVVDRFDKQIADIEVRAADAASPLASYRVDLSALPNFVPGRYSLVDDQGGSTAICYEPGFVDARPIGLVEIYSSTAAITPGAAEHVPAGYRFLDGDALTGADLYHLQFEPMATTWRYVVTKKYDNNGIGLDQLAIDGPLAFAKSVEGTRAVFTSQAEVRFSETSRSLKLKAGNKELRDLPDPGVSTVLGRGPGPSGFVADTHVYV